MYSKFTKSTYAQSTIEVKTAALVYGVKVPYFSVWLWRSIAQT